MGYNDDMNRRLLSVLAVALALVAVAAASGATPKLTVTSQDLFAVRGVRFHPGERVLVVVAAADLRASKRLRAGAAGGFTAQFPAVQFSSCEAYTVRATGDRGSQAILKVRPPECPQPPTP